MPVAPGPHGNTETYSGTVESADKSLLCFQIGGTISDIYVSEGDRVSRGQLIAKVKTGDYSNAHNIAQAELHEAQDAYARLKKLHDADALPEIKWVEIQDKLKQAENAAEIASRALEDAVLRSPVNGIVSHKLAAVGQSVLAANPIVEIVAVDKLEVTIPVSEDKIGGISEGQKGSVRFSSQNIGPVEGTVTSKSPVADPLTRAYTVKLSIPTADGKILPGMVGDVVMEGSVPSDSLASSSVLLPSQAVLLSSDNRNFVWVVDNGTAQRRFVKADYLSKGGIIIEEGLHKGDSVIVAGMQKVCTGTKVRTIVE